MRNVDDGKKEKKEKKRNKIMTFIVATNVIASRPPECRPTGTLHACAKRMAFLVATTSFQQSTARMATPERRPLERRTLVPKTSWGLAVPSSGQT